ncbi:MAG: hypothetical protein GW949_06780 [Spirochaetales bacterium]|nr:hypothetical protein [Spirochaetales bacterium]
MKNVDPLEILHLKNPDGTSRFYHQIPNSQALLMIGEESELAGYYGMEPRIEALRNFRESMYANVGQAVRIASLEKTFIPRFLLSSGVFLVVFLFLSLVIRDPIPAVDEIVISSISAVIFWFSLRRKRIRKEEEAEKELIIRERLDKTFFQPNPKILALENVWHQFYSEIPDVDARDLESWLLNRTSMVDPDLNLDSKYHHLIRDGIYDELGPGLSKQLTKDFLRIARGNSLSPLRRRVLYRLMNKTENKTRAQAVCLLGAVILLYHP